MVPNNCPCTGFTKIDNDYENISTVTSKAVAIASGMRSPSTVLKCPLAKNLPASAVKSSSKS